MFVNFLLKWLGVTTLKAAMGWLLAKYVTAPLVDALGDGLQAAIDDPDTEYDEQAVASAKKLVKYAIDKRLKGLF